jgi:protein-tyrosine phosphatase
MDLHWIDVGLAVSPRPEGGRLLGEDLLDARRQGVRILVSCLMPAEERELDLLEEGARAEAAGMTFIRARMPDGGVPGDDGAFEQIVRNLAAERAGGRRIAIHCRAGVGRSPLTAAAVLVLAGATPAEAWRRVAEARGWPVPDNDEQREYLFRFDRRLRAAGYPSP